MKEPVHREPVQETLFPPEAITTTVRLGVVGSADHAQLLVEVRNASDSTLLAMECNPHFPLAELDLRLKDYLGRALELTRPHVVPF